MSSLNDKVFDLAEGAALVLLDGSHLRWSVAFAEGTAVLCQLTRLLISLLDCFCQIALVAVNVGYILLKILVVNRLTLLERLVVEYGFLFSSDTNRELFVVQPIVLKVEIILHCDFLALCEGFCSFTEETILLLLILWWLRTSCWRDVADIGLRCGRQPRVRLLIQLTRQLKTDK